MASARNLQIRKMRFDEVEKLVVGAVDVSRVGTFDAYLTFNQVVGNYMIYRRLIINNFDC